MGLRSGLAGASRQSLNKAREKERKQGVWRAREQQGQDSPGVIASFF